MLSKNFFKRVGRKALKMYKHHIWNMELDVEGNKFPRYSPKYKELKSGNKLKRQWAGSTSSRAPWVTKDFYNDLKLTRATRNGFIFEWASQGQKVQHLADMKRKVTTQRNPLPKDVMIEVERQLRRELGKKVPKSKLHKIYLK